MVRECPRCRLVNPPTAPQCDCGYEFAAGRVTGPPVADHSREAAPGTRLLTGCLGVIVGVVQDDQNYLGEDVFKVENIVRKRLNEGVVEYLIKWEGWSR